MRAGNWTTFCTIVAALAAGASTAFAETVAYWRFDDLAPETKLEGELGTDKPPYTTAADASGRDNPLRAFNTRDRLFPPDTSGRIHAPDGLPPLAGGAANERCVRFTGRQDFYTPEPGSPINAMPLDRFTVEGMFKLDVLARRWDERAQVIVGKDGQPVRRLPYQPFVVVVSGRDNERVRRDCLSVNVIDAGGTFRVAASREPLEQDRWYAFAAVADGAALKLYLNRFDGNGYQLEGESPIEGGLFRSSDSWAVGRGEYNGEPNSWLQGWADEVRISDVALPPERWLAAGVGALPIVARPTTEPTTRPTLAVSGIADPEVIRHDGVYYAYGTKYPPTGFDVWSSPDLRKWTRTPDAIKAGPGTWGDSLYWAPGAIAHRGKFYLYYSSSGTMPEAGGQQSTRIHVAVADAPTGPFKEVVSRMPLLGRAVIDPQVFIDRDGRAFMYFVADIPENNGVGQIYVVRLSDDLLSPVGEPVPCLAPSQAWEGTVWNEGPFVFREGDTYVMTYSGEFWGSHRYAVGVATAPTPTGPWKKRDDNPFLSRYGGLVGTGHNSIARAPDDKGWLIFFHAHRTERLTTRDTFVARLVVDRDARGDVRLRAEHWEAGRE